MTTTKLDLPSHCSCPCQDPSASQTKVDCPPEYPHKKEVKKAVWKSHFIFFKQQLDVLILKQINFKMNLFTLLTGSNTGATISCSSDSFYNSSRSQNSL